jgi:hypothetical protein
MILPCHLFFVDAFILKAFSDEVDLAPAEELTVQQRREDICTLSYT